MPNVHCRRGGTIISTVTPAIADRSEGSLPFSVFFIFQFFQFHFVNFFIFGREFFHFFISRFFLFSHSFHVDLFHFVFPFSPPPPPLSLLSPPSRPP